MLTYFVMVWNENHHKIDWKDNFSDAKIIKM